MSDNKEKCNSSRDRMEVLIGQIKLLEREIGSRKNDIVELKKEIREARTEYKNIATKFGVSKAPVIFSKNKIENIISGVGAVSGMADAPNHDSVERALNNYNHTKLSNNHEIKSIEKEVYFIGRDINNISTEKGYLVENMRSIGYYNR